MRTTMQLPQYFSDVRDEQCMSATAIVHSRFSTNTFPSWPLAHPFRFVAHNGEINTARGNPHRMHAREAMLASSDIARLSPICTPDASDSESFALAVA
jgi:glutamate synthase (NADPH/NADH) large chain